VNAGSGVGSLIELQPSRFTQGGIGMTPRLGIHMRMFVTVSATMFR